MTARVMDVVAHVRGTWPYRRDTGKKRKLALEAKDIVGKRLPRLSGASYSSGLSLCQLTSDFL